MQTLYTLQKLSKLGKIISKIVFIVCIVGASLSLAAILGLVFLPENYTIGGTTIHQLVKLDEGMSVGTGYTMLACWIVFCVGEVILAKFAENYFTHELEAGTPFTYDGAKELIRLGTLTVCIPLAAALVATSVYQIMCTCFDDVKNMRIHNSISVGLGFMFIIMGLLCRHGAEISEKLPRDTEENR